MTNKIISSEQLNFTNECLFLYKSFCTNEDRDKLFNKCVEDRLNELLIDNSNMIDDIVYRLENFTNTVVQTDVPFNRCENYNRMLKEKSNSNIKYMKKLLNLYSKSCRMSTLVLKRLVKMLSNQRRV